MSWQSALEASGAGLTLRGTTSPILESDGQSKINLNLSKFFDTSATSSFVYAAHELVHAYINSRSYLAQTGEEALDSLGYADLILGEAQVLWGLDNHPRYPDQAHERLARALSIRAIPTNTWSDLVLSQTMLTSASLDPSLAHDVAHSLFQFYGGRKLTLLPLATQVRLIYQISRGLEWLDAEDVPHVS